MDGTGFATFDTAIGRCGIAWDTAHVLAIATPASDERALRARLRRVSGAPRPSPPPPFARRAIAAITAHLAGAAADLDTIPIDFSRVGDFDRGVLELTRAIPSGATRTYGEIAADLGDKQAARAVGAALGRNPWPIVVPCHRVLAANGKLGGFSAPGGRTTKLRLLEIEGVTQAESTDLFKAAAPAA